MNLLSFFARLLRFVGIAAMLLTCVAAQASATFTWQEEVLLHDGEKILVTRYVERAGRHEIGQEPPIKEQGLTFRLRGTNELVVWTDKFSAAIGSASFLPMQLEMNGTIAYLVVHPMGSVAYVNWGQPNPPYVVFKYERKQWRQIALEALPPEFSTPNLLFSSPDHEAKKFQDRIVPAAAISESYAGYRQPEFRTIVRTPIEQWNAHPVHPGPKAPHPIEASPPRTETLR
jgi:hypothetical protein